MAYFNLIRLAFSFLLIFISLPTNAGVTEGIQFLSSQIQSDGRITSQASLATPVQSTAESLTTLHTLKEVDQNTLTSGLQFLAQETHQNTEGLSRLIIASAQQGSIDDSLVSKLKTYQNGDGGFGSQPGYSSTPLDTAFALLALQAGNSTTANETLSALGYLLNQQTGNGGWSFAPNASQSYVTALCIQSISPYAQDYQNVSGAISQAQTFLISQQDNEHLWQEDFQSAQALLALLASGAGKANIQQSVTALTAHQTVTGSWQEDAFTTALVLRVLQGFQAISNGVDSSQSGSVIGTVLVSGSSEPIAGATIALVAKPGTNVLSNDDGSFRLTGIPAGMQTLSVTRPGYAGANSIITIYTDQQSHAGDIVLGLNLHRGLVRGTVTDGLNQSSLSEVSVTLSGPQTYQIQTNAQGSFELSDLMAGTYTLTMEKTGYQTMNGQLSVTNGELRYLKLSLLKTGAYLDTDPGNINGRIIDGISGAGIANAQLSLSNGTVATTDDQGFFILTAMARGTYQTQLTAAGYQTQNISFGFPPGISGNLGDIKSYPLTEATAPTHLTVLGQIVDGISGQGVSNANVQSGSYTVTTDDQGLFVLNELTTLDVELQLSAMGYESRQYSLTASGFGEVQHTFALPPTHTDTGQTSSILSGSVINSITGLPIAGASISLNGGTAITDESGQYTLSDISELDFDIHVFATTYSDKTQSITLSTHGHYTLDISLNSLEQNTEHKFQIVALNTQSASVGADGVSQFTASVENLTDQALEALIIGEIVNAENEIVATVSPYLPETTREESHYAFTAHENKQLDIAWETEQNLPGVYRLLLRIIEPETISQTLPTGVVWAEDETSISLHATREFTGTIAIQPHITQAGTKIPVKLAALLVNSGNVPLGEQTFQLTISHPDTSAILHQTTAHVADLEVIEHVQLSFGEWIPTEQGNLILTVQAQDINLQGSIEGQLYVGDKSNGTFTVDKTIVPEGNQTVQAKIKLEGVDTSIGTFIDPLYFAVKKAVTKGGEYTAREAINWQKRYRCIGCHTQTQSLVGVASAYQKGLGDKQSAKFMFNTVSSVQQNDGGLRANHWFYYTKTQTALGLWALTAWDNIQESFKTIYKAARHMYYRRSQSGNKTWWRPDVPEGWWRTYASITALTVKGYVHLLESAQTIDLTTISDYSLKSYVNLKGAGSRNYPLDLEPGPDGMLYNIKRNGSIVRINPNDNSVQLVGRSGHNSFGLAIDEEGIQYIVGDNGRLTRLDPDGALTTLLSGGGSYTDIEIGPDGLLYIVDHTNHRLLRVTDPELGQIEVVYQQGMISKPYGLAFDTQGNAIIANYGGWNIVKVTMEGTASIFADGLEYRPIWITSDQQGGFYYSSLELHGTGKTPSAINYVNHEGIVERLRSGDRLRGTTLLNGQVYVANYYGNQLYQLNEKVLDTGLLANFSNEVTRASHYFLAHYRDNTSNNITHAMRLMGLGEARKVITDETLLTKVDTAIAYIAQLLRTRQRSDGGWGRYTYKGSDAIATAQVALALDYTNPSADDPLIRKTIHYLLNTQQSNHSWVSSNRILNTRLSATSLVIAYLPVALERLGGIEVGLHLSTPENINLQQPSIVPTAQTNAANNQTDYLWQLPGVTSKSRELTFNIDLLNMLLAEERPVANAAYIQFKNSFTNEHIRVDLSIPTVKAVSELRLQLATDKTNYQANEAVAINLDVDNTGSTTAAGQIELQIRAVGSTAALDTLQTQTATDIPAGQQISLSSDWHIGVTLAGEYQVVARLLDPQNRLLDQQTTSFSIVHGDSPVLDGQVITNKAVYQAWDQVIINSRIANISANVIQAETHYELTVTEPSGNVVLSENGQINELVPGALQDRQFNLPLVDAPDGQYAVTWTIQDGFNRGLLTTEITTFTLERHSLQGLTGQVEANPLQVYQGDPIQCMEQISNLAASDLSAVRITHQLIQAETRQQIKTQQQTLMLTGGQVLNESYKINTAELAVGEYACLLTAIIDGQSKQLGAALFKVLEPPVKIAGSLNAGDRGRVLVLIDDTAKQCAGYQQFSVDTMLSTPIAAGTIVTGILYDHTDTMIEQETGLLDEQIIDLNPGTENVNLVLSKMTPTRLEVALVSQTKLGQGYRVVITTVNNHGTTSYDSGMINTDCTATLTTSDVYGDFSLIEVNPVTAANDPLGPNHLPDLTSQRKQLENVLTEAGWSYTLTRNADDFTRELHTGGYITYLLLSEQIKLAESVQKQLREAIYRGEGLIEAGGHDQRQGRLDDALGIKSQGKHTRMQGFQLSDNSWVNAGQAEFQLNDRSLKITVPEATVLANFIDQEQLSVEAAITAYTYGHGRSLHIGFDLAAEMALENADPQLQTLLLDALNAVHPDNLTARVNSVYPMRLTLQNQGIATSGQAVLTIPDTVSVIDTGEAAVNGLTLIWPCALAESEQLIFDTWFQLPDEPVQFSALIQSGIAPEWKDQASFTFEILPEPILSIESLQQAAALNGKDYKQVQKYLDRALNESRAAQWQEALKVLLHAADALIPMTTEDSKVLRQQLAEVIRTVSMKLD